MAALNELQQWERRRVARHIVRKTLGLEVTLAIDDDIHEEYDAQTLFLEKFPEKVARGVEGAVDKDSAPIRTAARPLEVKDCQECGAVCCRYINVTIKPPTTPLDLDEIIWWVAHKGVTVSATNGGTWHLRVMVPCENLAEDNTCRDYERRSVICRAYDCTGDLSVDDEYEYEFNSPDEVIEHRDWFESMMDMESKIAMRVAASSGEAE